MPDSLPYIPYSWNEWARRNPNLYAAYAAGVSTAALAGDVPVAATVGSAGQLLEGVGGAVDAALSREEPNFLTRMGNTLQGSTRTGYLSSPVRQEQAAEYDRTERERGSVAAIRAYPREALLRAAEFAGPAGAGAGTSALLQSRHLARPAVAAFAGAGVETALQAGQTYANNAGNERWEQGANTLRQEGTSLPLNAVGNMARYFPYAWNPRLTWVANEFGEGVINTVMEQVGPSTSYLNERRRMLDEEILLRREEIKNMYSRMEENRRQRRHGYYQSLVPNPYSDDPALRSVENPVERGLR